MRMNLQLIPEPASDQTTDVTHNAGVTSAGELTFAPSSSKPFTTTPTAPTPSTTLRQVLMTLVTDAGISKDHHDLTTAIPRRGDIAVDVNVDVAGLNTPLNAPEASLEPVTDQGQLGMPSHVSELGWIVPITLLSIAIMIGLAFLLYLGVRKLELRMLGWCYRNCPCCCAPGGGQGGRVLRGEQYDTLSEETDRKGRKESVRLRDFRENSPSYGVTRSTTKEYSPSPEFSGYDDGER